MFFRFRSLLICSTAILLQFVLVSAAKAQSVENQITESIIPDSLMNRVEHNDSARRLTWSEYYAKLFIDSFKVDSLKQQLYAPLEVKLPNLRIAQSPDPYNPFLHETFLRVARGRFWFFGLSIFIIIYFIYFRAVFSKQMEMRMKSFLRKYYFEDLIKEQKISSLAGSVHAYLISLLVFCQGVLLFIITSEYVKLNSILTYVLALIVVFLMFSIHYLFQMAFAGSLEIREMWNRQFQRQININLIFALIALPVFLFFYYNGSKFQDINLSLLVLTMLIMWISVRLVYLIIGLIQDNFLSFVSILYFCTLELIPYLLLFKYIKKFL